jgi:hypothetical protein
VNKLFVFTALLCATSSAALADQFSFSFSSGTPQSLTINGTTTVQTFLSGDWFGRSQGWWSATEPNSDNNDNYYVGDLGLQRLNNFFTFAIPDGLGPIVSADLSITQTVVGGLPFTYSLYDVSTAAITLNQNNGTSNAIFNDLGSGVSYGSIVINDNSNVVISLNAAGLQAISDAQGGLFSVGGTLHPGAVPEPASMALMGLGLAAVAARRRFRKA